MQARRSVTRQKRGVARRGRVAGRSVMTLAKPGQAEARQSVSKRQEGSRGVQAGREEESRQGRHRRDKAGISESRPDRNVRRSQARNGRNRRRDARTGILVAAMRGHGKKQPHARSSRQGQARRDMKAGRQSRWGQ
jgi:hypothetical protein